MIVGVGHDICRIDRIARIFDRYGERFVTRICTEAELAELALRADKPAYLAKRFAVKEAVYKALHQADQSDMRWHDAETLSSMHKAGAPQLTLYGGCRLIFWCQKVIFLSFIYLLVMIYPSHQPLSSLRLGHHRRIRSINRSFSGKP